MSICLRTARNGKANKGPLDDRLEETRKLPGPTRGKDRTKIAELFADERCSQALLDFLATTDLGRTAGPSVAEEGEEGASEAFGVGRQRTRGAAHTVEGGGGETWRRGVGG